LGGSESGLGEPRAETTSTCARVDGRRPEQRSFAIQLEGDAADDVTVAPGAEFSRCSLVMRDNKVVAAPF